MTSSLQISIPPMTSSLQMSVPIPLPEQESAAVWCQICGYRYLIEADSFSLPSTEEIDEDRGYRQIHSLIGLNKLTWRSKLVKNNTWNAAVSPWCIRCVEDSEIDELTHSLLGTYFPSVDTPKTLGPVIVEFEPAHGGKAYAGGFWDTALSLPLYEECDYEEDHIEEDEDSDYDLD
jgi:hypothetical protein